MKNTHVLSNKLINLESIQTNAHHLSSHFIKTLSNHLKPLGKFLTLIPEYLKKSFLEMQDDMILLGYHIYSEHPNLFSTLMTLKQVCTYVGLFRLSMTIYRISKFSKKYGQERSQRILMLEN